MAGTAPDQAVEGPHHRTVGGYTLDIDSDWVSGLFPVIGWGDAPGRGAVARLPADRQPDGVLMARRNDRMETIVSLAKRRGFVFPSSDIYGGLRASWDYGPLGVEMKNNIKRQWWKAMVQERDDIVGLDSSVILAREVWEASGHVTEFVDPLTECQSCHRRFRADHLIEAYEDKHGHPPENGLNDIACPHCGTRGAFTEPRMFNGLLRTFLGATEDESGLAYLRPETAQGIFINFRNVLQTSRKKVPFGIGQIGNRSATRSPRGTSSSGPASSSRWRWSSSSSPGTDEDWH